MKEFLSKLNARFFLIPPAVCFAVSPLWPHTLRDARTAEPMPWVVLLCLLCLCAHFFMGASGRYERIKLKNQHLLTLYIFSFAAAVSCLSSGVFGKYFELLIIRILYLSIRICITAMSIYLFYDTGRREKKVYSGISDPFRRRIDTNRHTRITRDRDLWDRKQKSYADLGRFGAALFTAVSLFMRLDTQGVIRRYVFGRLISENLALPFYLLAAIIMALALRFYGNWILIEDQDTLPFRI